MQKPLRQFICERDLTVQVSIDKECLIAANYSHTMF